MNEYFFRSSLSPYMNEYLRSLYARGLKATHTGDFLREFDLYLLSKAYDKPFLDRETYDGFLDRKRTSCKPFTVYQLATVLRNLALFMTHLGNDSYVPRLPRRNFTKCVSYTFSIDEMKRIFDACDTLEHKIRKASSSLMTVPPLVRLLYSTGMRIREALAIRNREVDFRRHLITLGSTKNGRQRLAALKPSMENVLKQYRQTSRERHIRSGELFIRQRAREKSVLYGNLRGVSKNTSKSRHN